jgi:SMP-30/Gluconolactonase/LRE-like region
MIILPPSPPCCDQRGSPGASEPPLNSSGNARKRQNGGNSLFAVTNYRKTLRCCISRRSRRYGLRGDGNLYAAVHGQGDVTVPSPEGDVVRRIETTGRQPTNVAFGRPGEQRIYVTEVEFGRSEAFEVEPEGLRLY